VLATDAPPLPPARADAARVRQIVGNLLSNAIKYTQQGRVSVRVVATTNGGPHPGAWSCVMIEDTGPGIPEEQQEHLFEEFTRFTSDSPGSGLGLAISRNLAEALGGAITLRSKPGEGTCFTLWLPSATTTLPTQEPTQETEPV
jgi:signal transduction histidine kinase